MRIKGILVILTIVIIAGISIALSTSQVPKPGLQDSAEMSDEAIVQPDAGKSDTVQASDEVMIEKQIDIDENGLNYYLDENGVKHYIIEVDDVAATEG